LSDPQSISAVQPGARGDVRVSIARAAQATGMDFDYLLAQAKLESALNPSARAPTSSAAGLYQFTSGTWLNTLERHGAQHGMDWANSLIAGGKVTDPGARAQIMAMRYDPDASAMMAAELASDNRADLSGLLGREPDAAELYLAHFLGSGGAREFLTALNADPSQSAAAVAPKAAAANRTIFFDPTGAPRSVAQVMEVLRGKVSAAMENGGLPQIDYDTTQLADFQPAQQPQFTGGPIARQFAAARQEMSGGGDGAGSPQARPSMAETLQTAFAVAGPDGQVRVPDAVRAAYGRLQQFGL
jgi:hypothetical protein